MIRIYRPQAEKFANAIYRSKFIPGENHQEIIQSLNFAHLDGPLTPCQDETLSNTDTYTHSTIYFSFSSDTQQVLLT